MITTSLLRGSAAVFAVLLASCASDLDTTRVPMSASVTPKQSSVITKLDRSLTNYRQSIGKSAIPRHAALDRLAQQHCLFMA